MLINTKHAANKRNYFSPTKWDGEINLQTFQTQNINPTADFFLKMLLRRKQPVKLSEERVPHISPNGLQAKVNPKLLSVGVLQENA